MAEEATYEKRYRKISAEEAKEMLANKERKLDAIQKKLILLCKEFEQLEHPEELLAAAALSSNPVKIVSSKGGGSDTFAILNRFYRQQKERRDEICHQMQKLSEEADDIRRLWSCFFALRDPYYGILHDLYVKKELYAAAEAAFGYSHRIFEKRRRDGLELLAELFNSPYSGLELMERGGR